VEEEEEEGGIAVGGGNLWEIGGNLGGNLGKIGGDLGEIPDPAWENLQPLTVDLWRAILQRLRADVLARAACVCRLWRSIAADPMVLSGLFRESWKLSRVFGRPMSTSFWSDAGLGRFAISHPVTRWDSIASLAVKYQVHVSPPLAPRSRHVGISILALSSLRDVETLEDVQSYKRSFLPLKWREYDSF
jgi:hypothetical protein